MEANNIFSVFPVARWYWSASDADSRNSEKWNQLRCSPWNLTSSAAPISPRADARRKAPNGCGALWLEPWARVRENNGLRPCPTLLWKYRNENLQRKILVTTEKYYREATGCQLLLDWPVFLQQSNYVRLLFICHHVFRPFLNGNKNKRQGIGTRRKCVLPCNMELALVAARGLSSIKIYFLA